MTGDTPINAPNTLPVNANQDSEHFDAAYSLETRQQTIAHYSSWAKSYDEEVGKKNRYAQPDRAAEMVSRFCNGTSARILDAGCGSGLSGVALRAAGFSHLDGCDFSPEMLEQAHHKEVYTCLWEADLNEGQPEIADETYDAITCVGVFSFGHVFPAACDDLIRLLKAQGLLVIALNEQFWEKGELATKIDELVKAKKVVELAREYGDHLPGHDVKGWVLALRKR